MSISKGSNIAVEPQTQLYCRSKQSWRRSYEKTHIIFLAETEEAADLGGTLGSETLGVHGVGETGDVGVALLDDAQGKDGQVHGDDAAANRLPLALTSAAGAVSRVAVGEEQADTGWVHDTLLHGEALLVVASSDAEDVALELVADGVTRDLSTHLSMISHVSHPILLLRRYSSAFVKQSRCAGLGATYALLEEDMGLALLLDVEELLAAVGREGNVQL